MNLRHLVLCLALLPACGPADDAEGASTPHAGTAGAGGAAGGAGASAGGAAGHAGGAGAAACEPPPAAPVFEAGTGQSCFERLAPGQTVPVIQGPQGGFHIWLAVGCADCGPAPMVEFGVKDLATGEFYPGYPGPQKQVVEATATPWRQKAGLTASLPGMPWDPASQLPKGKHVLLSASVLEVGTSAVLHTSEVEVVLGDVIQWNPCASDPGCGQPGGAPCCTKGGELDGAPTN